MSQQRCTAGRCTKQSSVTVMLWVTSVSQQFLSPSVVFSLPTGFTGVSVSLSLNSCIFTVFSQTDVSSHIPQMWGHEIPLTLESISQMLPHSRTVDSRLHLYVRKKGVFPIKFLKALCFLSDKSSSPLTLPFRERSSVTNSPKSFSSRATLCVSYVGDR